MSITSAPCAIGPIDFTLPFSTTMLTFSRQVPAFTSSSRPQLTVWVAAWAPPAASMRNSADNFCMDGSSKG